MIEDLENQKIRKSLENIKIWLNNNIIEKISKKH